MPDFVLVKRARSSNSSSSAVAEVFDTVRAYVGPSTFKPNLRKPSKLPIVNKGSRLQNGGAGLTGPPKISTSHYAPIHCPPDCRPGIARSVARSADAVHYPRVAGDPVPGLRAGRVFFP